MLRRFGHLLFLTVLLIASLHLSGAQSLTVERAAQKPQSPGDAVQIPIGGQLGFDFVTAEAGSPGPVVKRAPYSLEATIESAQALADGNRIVHRHMVRLYRDSQGRTRREETLAAIGPWSASGTPTTLITIQDPVSGKSYFVDPQRKIATKAPSLPNPKQNQVAQGPEGGIHSLGVKITPEGSGLVAPGDGGTAVLGFGPGRTEKVPHPEEKTESIGQETIAGVSADGTRTVSTIPANTIGNERPIEIVRERWYSPDLQLVLRSTQTDPRFGETTYEVTKLERTEPQHSLFEIPSDYHVREGPGLMKLDH